MVGIETQKSVDEHRIWRWISGQLRYLRHTALREEALEMRRVIEWVMKNAETLRIVMSAQKAGVKIAETLEAALDNRATLDATLAEQARRFNAKTEEKQA